MEQPIVIVADDLTGACDAGVHFAVAGLRSEVSLDGTTPTSEVAVFSTDTRDEDDATIRARIEALAATVRPNLVFKKIDSLLRGRPGFEIAVALEAFKCTTAIITPAFPEMMRFVVGGFVLGQEPIHIAARLRMDGLNLDGCEILDARTNADLDAIAARKSETKEKILWCGSGGLAMALAKRVTKGALTSPAKPASGPVTFCIGSTHEATISQLHALAPSARIVRIDRNSTTAGEIRGLLDGPLPAALFASGGDTATMVLKALGTSSVALAGEIVRGVPWGTMRGGIMDGVPVVTKSGGFGAPDTLIRVAAFFNQSA